jgi:hypothetical protein
MSRKKTPEERRLSGYYRPSRHGPLPPPGRPRLEPEAEPLPAEPPYGPELNEEELGLWRIARVEAPWLRACDAGLVRLWCVHSAIVSTAMAARAHALAEGELEAAALYDGIIDRNGRTVLKASQLLGFTPAARRKLGLEPDPVRQVFHPTLPERPWPPELA